MASEKVIIRWITKHPDSIRFIRERFGIPAYTTVNGFSPAAIDPEDREMFEETARYGYFSFVRADWHFNGLSYSW